MNRKLDALWSQAVKAKAGYKCERCLKTRYLNSHHLFSRRYKGLRYDINNGFCLCAGCHIQIAHQKPSVFVLWALDSRGEDWHNQLLLKSQKICKHLDEKLIELELKGIIKNAV